MFRVIAILVLLSIPTVCVSHGSSHTKKSGILCVDVRIDLDRVQRCFITRTMTLVYESPIDKNYYKEDNTRPQGIDMSFQSLTTGETK